LSPIGIDNSGGLTVAAAAYDYSSANAGGINAFSESGKSPIGIENHGAIVSTATTNGDDVNTNSYAIVAETLGGISAIGIVNDAALTAIATANGDDSHAVAIGISACRSSSPLARTSGMRAPTPGSTEPQICGCCSMAAAQRRSPTVLMLATSCAGSQQHHAGGVGERLGQLARPRRQQQGLIQRRS
jgi:hypothetical protein